MQLHVFASIMAKRQTACAEYYDIIISGKTGRGKSTLGNKLLSSESSTVTDHVFRTADDVDQSESIHYVTKNCELKANEQTKIRVLDTPGFSPSKMGSVSVHESNLQIARWIVREQLNPKNKMRVQRLLYFMPERGTPGKADAVLQGELKVMYHYFGIELFNHMIIIATQDLRYQSYEYTKTSCDRVRQVFFSAASMVTSNELAACPPVLYLGYDDSRDDVLQCIKAAKVLRSEGFFVPAFRDDVCSRCSGQIRHSKTGERIPIGVLQEDEFLEYEESKCHPYFVPKYSKMKKIMGGIGHVATLGIPYGIAKARGKHVWPGILNSDEKCPNCSCSPGFQGCVTVLTTVKVKAEYVTVDHTNKL